VVFYFCFDVVLFSVFLIFLIIMGWCEFVFFLCSFVFFLYCFFCKSARPCATIIRETWIGGKTPRRMSILFNTKIVNRYFTI